MGLRAFRKVIFIEHFFRALELILSEKVFEKWKTLKVGERKDLPGSNICSVVKLAVH